MEAPRSSVVGRISPDFNTEGDNNWALVAKNINIAVAVEGMDIRLFKTRKEARREQANDKEIGEYSKVVKVKDFVA